MTTALQPSTPRQCSRGRAVSSAPFEPGRFALRDTWFPIEHLPRVKRTPRLRHIHGQPYWLWRDGGQPRASEVAPEQLGQRTTTASEFSGGSGQYPAEQRYGYLWVWFGDPSNAAPELIPDIPHLPHDGKPAHIMRGTLRFGCTYELACENLLDISHVDCVQTTFPGRSRFHDDQITVESTSETITTISDTQRWRVPPALRWQVGSDTQDVRWIVHLHLRNGVAVMHADFGPETSVHLLQNFVPESATVTRLLYTVNPPRTPSLTRNLLPVLRRGIMARDNAILRAQNPRYLQPAGRTDANSQFDAAVIAYRIGMQKLIQRQRVGDFSYQSDGRGHQRAT